MNKSKFETKLQLIEIQNVTFLNGTSNLAQNLNFFRKIQILRQNIKHMDVTPV